jgi:hypothetical protein
MQGAFGQMQHGEESGDTAYGFVVDQGPSSPCTGAICAQESVRSDQPDQSSHITITAQRDRHALVSLRRSGNLVGGTVKLGTNTIVDRAAGAMPDGVFGPARVVVGSAFVHAAGTQSDVSIDNVMVTLTPTP